MRTSGHCLCRNIRYAFDGPPLWVAHCHCESCRRQTSSMLATFVGVARDRLTYLSGEPARYESSPGVLRTFCPSCGSPIAFESEAKHPGEVHLYHGTLADPSAYQPTAHVHTDEQVSWFEVHDDLPRFATSEEGVKSVRHGPRHKDARGSA